MEQTFASATGASAWMSDPACVCKRRVLRTLNRRRSMEVGGGSHERQKDW